MPHHRYPPFADVTANYEKIVFAPHLASPDGNKFTYAYFVRIQNYSSETIRLIGRKWVLHELPGQSFVIEGDGIIGKFPILAPGESFEYQSFHSCSGPTKVFGTYFGLKEGERNLRSVILNGVTLGEL